MEKGANARVISWAGISIQVIGPTADWLQPTKNSDKKNQEQNLKYFFIFVPSKTTSNSAEGTDDFPRLISEAQQFIGYF
jgi:hypothetical protein